MLKPGDVVQYYSDSAHRHINGSLGVVKERRDADNVYITWIFYLGSSEFLHLGFAESLLIKIAEIPSNCLDKNFASCEDCKSDDDPTQV